LLTSWLDSPYRRFRLTAGELPAALVRLGMLRPFQPCAVAGSAPWHYVFGPIGAAMLGTEDRAKEMWVSGQWSS
jgi:hypothetical protein